MPEIRTNLILRTYFLLSKLFETFSQKLIMRSGHINGIISCDPFRKLILPTAFILSQDIHRCSKLPDLFTIGKC